MKSKLLIIIFFLSSNLIMAQSIGINDSGTLPDNSAMLDIQSNSKGVLIPRMNSGQRTGIMPAAEGLLVFDTDTKSFWFYNGGWIELVSGNINELSDNDGNTKIQVEKSTNDNNIRFDIDGDEVMVIDETGEVEIRSKSINSPGFLSLNNIDTSHFLRIYGGKGDEPDPYFAWQTGTALRFVTADKFFGGFQERWRMISNRLEPLGTGGSVFIGFDAGLNDDLTDNRNIAIGDFALQANISGSDNTALGNNALNDNTIGFNNVAVGYNTLSSNIDGIGNVAIGYRPMFHSTSGDYNVGIGQEALFMNTIGNNNVGIGLQALHLNTDGDQNTGIGVNALFSNLSGNDNSALGYQALNRNTSGNENSASGVRALFYNQTGTGNTAVGYEAMKGEVGNSSGSKNTSVGYQSLFSNSTGYDNTSIGNEALYKNKNGYSNTASGAGALYSNVGGYGNSAFGVNTLYNNTSGIYNMALGHQSMFSNTEGDYNIALGYLALEKNEEGNDNVSIGTQSLSKNRSGGLNISIGYQSLFENIHGENNIAMGREALKNNIIGDYNIAIGNFSGPLTADSYNSTTIGYSSVSNCDNCIILGGVGGFAVNVGIGTTNPTKARLQVEGTTGDNDFQAFWYSVGGPLPNPIGFSDVTLTAHFADDVAGSSFYSFSDKRIKNIKGRSNSKLDLKTIMNIEVTDYSMIDTISKGNKNYKKVIAQQVAEVFPQAVSSDLTDVIPDIYKKAEITDGWIQLSSDLKIGERVKLITEKTSMIYDVIDVNSSGFRVANLPENTDRVFVYGREVNDFHIVDYEALSMLNISATQAQQEIIKAQQLEINSLNTQLDMLMKRMDKMEATNGLSLSRLK